MKKRMLILLLILGLIANPFLASANSYYQVVGDSMNPVINDGDTIQIVSETYEDGDMVVAQLEDGRKIVKRLMGDHLVSAGQGTSYPVSEVTILGAAEYVPMSMGELELYGFSWESVLAEGVTIVQVAGGTNHTLALTDTGVLYGWGCGPSVGKDCSEGVEHTPIKLSAGDMGTNSGITAIAANNLISLALKDSVVYAWGQGAIGDDSIEGKKYAPFKVLAGEMDTNFGVTAIAAGFNHVLAIKEGVVYGWGANGNRQIGDGSNNYRTEPVKVSAGAMGTNSGVQYIAAGWANSVAVKEGVVYGWGFDYDQSPIPVKLEAGEMGTNSGITAIAKRGYNTLAIKESVVYAWGIDNSGVGLLGNNTTGSQMTPVKVWAGEMGTNSDITAISAGNNHSLVLKDGIVYGWGNNSKGQLGVGGEMWQTTNKHTPVKVFAGEMDANEDVTAILAVTDHSYAIKNKEVYVWGMHHPGGLGEGRQNFSSIPVNLNRVWNPTSSQEQGTVTIKAIGIVAPVPGAMPVTNITPTNQYTGSVVWLPNPNPFQANTNYTAIITLTANEGFTLEGVTANFFTVAGANIVTNTADTGVVTAIFPTTPAAPAAPVITEITITTQPKLTYTYQQTLDLSEMRVRITYSDSTIETDILHSALASKGIVLSKAHGATLAVSDSSSVITLSAGEVKADTNALIVLDRTVTDILLIQNLPTLIYQYPATMDWSEFKMIVEYDDETIEEDITYDRLESLGITTNVPQGTTLTVADANTIVKLFPSYPDANVLLGPLVVVPVEIAAVTVNGLLKPVTGQMPRRATQLSGSTGANYTIDTVNYYVLNDSSWAEHTGAFIPNKKYKAAINVVPKTNYAFNDLTPPTVTVENGSTQDVITIAQSVTFDVIFKNDDGSDHVTSPVITPIINTHGSDGIDISSNGAVVPLTLNVSGLFPGYNVITWTVAETADDQNILTIPDTTTGTLTNGIVQLGQFTVIANATDEPSKTATVTITFSGNTNGDYAALPTSAEITLNLESGVVRPGAPNVGLSYAIERLTGINNTMEYVIDSNSIYTSGVFTSFSGSTYSLTDTIPSNGQLSKYIHIRTKENTTTPASNIVTIEIKARPTVPTGLSGVNTSATAGKIVGTTTLMQYKASTSTVYIACTATETQNLAAGIYQTRFSPTATNFASEPIAITVPGPVAFEITGSVTEEDNTEVTGAAVKLMQGQALVADTSTDATGEYKFINVPNGSYNIIITKDDRIVTRIITIIGDNGQAGTAILPSGKKNSIVEVRDNTPSIVVGALDEQLTNENVGNNDNNSKGVTRNDIEIVAAGGSVTLKLVAEGKVESEAINATDIQSRAQSNSKIIGQFLDLSVIKQVTTIANETTLNNVSELPSLLEIHIPMDDSMKDKTGFVIYRYHGSQVDTISLDNGAGKPSNECFRIVGDTITLYVNKFSTYAIAYNPPSSGGSNGGSSGGSSTIYYNLIYKAQEGGSITGNTSQTIASQTNGSEVTAKANEGYKFIGWSDGVETATRQDKSVTKNINVTAAFEKITEDGKTSDGGKVVFNEDESKITITPDDGNVNVDVTIDGQSVGTITVSDTVVVIPYEVTEAINKRNGSIETATDDIEWTMTGDQLKKMLDNSPLKKELDNSGADSNEIDIVITAKQTDKDKTDRIRDLVNTSNTTIVSRLYDIKAEIVSGQTREVTTNLQGIAKIRIPVPEGQENYTTAVRFDENGNMYHIPTNFKWINGRLYAEINSFTAGTYGIVYTPRTFDDVIKHWSEQTVNNMASRLIVVGVGNNLYEPERNTTRAEFVTLLVRALGIAGINNEQTAEFSDVTTDKWYYEVIKIAKAQGFVKGYGNNEFKPQETITRQEAMIIVARAARFTDLAENNNKGTDILNNYTDQSDVALWAKDDVALVVGLEIFTGLGNNDLKPKENISRAQSAHAISNLLTISQLINR